MLGGRAVATSSRVLDSVPHRASDAATRRAVGLPIESALVGGRNACACEAGSIAQPPPGAAQATRESLSVNALLPIAACSVSAYAKRGAPQKTTSEQSSK